VILARTDFANVFGRVHGLVVKGKRTSCPPQQCYRDPARRTVGTLRQRHDFAEHRFPLTRSLQASVQRSTSVLFSFVLSLDCGRISHHPAIKNDSNALSQWAGRIAAHRGSQRRHDDRYAGTDFVCRSVMHLPFAYHLRSNR
jgi:hypothetical protein